MGFTALVYLCWLVMWFTALFFFSVADPFHFDPDQWIWFWEKWIWIRLWSNEVDPDPCFLKWIRIQHNEVNPGGSGSTTLFSSFPLLHLHLWDWPCQLVHMFYLQLCDYHISLFKYLCFTNGWGICSIWADKSSATQATLLPTFLGTLKSILCKYYRKHKI